MDGAADFGVSCVRRTARRERGAALVEFALIAPLLMMLVMGILTGGTAYEQKIAITHAAREGGRFGATLALDQIFTSGTWATNIQQLVISRASNDLNVPSANVCVSLVEGSAGSGGGVYVVGPTSNPATPNAATSYTTLTTGGAATPCDTTETYPLTANDLGRRVQVRVRRGATLQAVMFSMNLTLTANATVKYEGTTTS
jgi:Flp pilus assembly protein TadG